MRHRFSLAPVAVALFIVIVGCDFINTPTKMGQGQLYSSGDGRYDPYFDTVHKEQLVAANWGDDSKTARKPIVTALNLHPHTSNGSIIAATRDKKGDPAVGRAVDETTVAELEFSRRLNVASARLDELDKKGDDLKRQASDDKKNAGAEKADEKKMAHKDEVRREMSAAVDAVNSMADDAHKYAKEADELAAKLKLTWSDGKDDGTTPTAAPPPPPSATTTPPPPPEKKKPEPVAKKPAQAPIAAKKPSTKTPDPPEEKKPSDLPPPKPPPVQKPPDEVFNP
jgi:hypothetical protein